MDTETKFPETLTKDLLNLNEASDADSQEKTIRLKVLEKMLEDEDTASKENKRLYRSIVNFLQFEGQSETLANWIISQHMSQGKIMEPSSEKPVASVIIPCCNHGEHLRQCIESILMQTFTHIEIIIINNGSTDNTPDVIQQLLADYPEQRIRYYNQQNMGLVQPHNRAVTVAKGEFILPIDAADLIAPEFLERTVPVLQKNKDLGYVSTKTLFFGEKNIVRPKEKFDPVRELVTNQLPKTTLYRRAMWKDIKGYDERMIHGLMDWEFWIRATKNGWFGTQLEEPLFFSRNEVRIDKAQETAVKKQIISLHPDIYDASRLRSCKEEIQTGNLIPPSLVRDELTIVPKNSAAPVRISNPDHAAEKQLQEFKERILAVLAANFPVFKKHFAGTEAGKGPENKIAAMFGQTTGIVSKLVAAGQFDEAIDLSAALLSKFPLSIDCGILFAQTLLAKGLLQAAYTVASLFFSISQENKKLNSFISSCLCIQSDQQVAQSTSLGMLEGAVLFSPESEEAWKKLFDLQVQTGLPEVAEKTNCKRLQRSASVNTETPKDDRKHIWYVSNAFSFAEGGMNGVSQAKIMTLGALLCNSDKFRVTIVTPLTTALPEGIAEFAEQHLPLMKKNKADWPDIVATIRKAPVGNKLLKGKHTPCREINGKADLVIVEGIRIYPHKYLMELGLDFDCPKLFMHHNSPHHYSGEITDAGTLPAFVKALQNYKYNISVSRTVAEQWKSIPELKNLHWIDILNCIRESELESITAHSREGIQQKLGLDPDDFNIICLASVQRRKGQDILLAQMENILKEVPNAKVTFVGPILDNRNGPEIVAASKGKSYSHRVEFIGPRKNALEYLYAGDLLALPSREEALPLSILEAMALGRTSVASKVNGVPELIEEGKTGLMFSIDTPDDLAEKIIYLAKNPEELDRFSENAKQKYWNCFSREQHVGRWREILLGIFNDAQHTAKI
ncbi:glycosyltransferase [Maridesulfovibrio bastinii]|uniref:glycosyltransferase n=1 Tax=Maridesulfovibrio bastinii TaxID=47157 RepID=UPI00040CF068|nr:glycosyltransferase [Maridesulfovibrio bastinii]